LNVISHHLPVDGIRFVFTHMALHSGEHRSSSITGILFSLPALLAIQFLLSTEASHLALALCL